MGLINQILSPIPICYQLSRTGVPLLVLFFIFSRLISAQQVLPIPLEPILVEDTITERSLPRSISWPTEHFQPPPSLNLPQLNEALNTLNGVQTRSQGSPTFSIRGSGQSGRTLVLYNDIPLNFASGFGPPLIFLPKEIVKNITVVKGPASLFYGSQAMSGSLNFQSEKYEKAQAVLTFSDPDESFLPWRNGGLAHNSLQLASPLLQNKKHQTQISYFNENDDGQFSYRSSNTSGVRSINSQNLSRLVFESASRWRRLYLTSNAIVGRHIRQSPGPTSFPLPTREETEGYLVSLTPHYFLSSNLSVKTQISYMGSDSEFTDNQGETSTNQASLILQNELIYEWGPKNQLQIFADSFRHDLEGSFLSQKQEQSQLEFGPFLSLQPSWSPLVYKLGGRLLPQFNRFLSTAAIERPLASGKVWLSFSEGFRNPSLSDLFSDTPFFVGNTQLVPEISLQYELGWQNNIPLLWAQWGYEIRLYEIQYRDFIETFEITPGLFSRENQGQGFARGLDWENSLQMSSTHLLLRYNFLDTENKRTGHVFRLSPRQQLTWGGSVALSTETLLEVQNTYWFENYDIVNNQEVRLKDWNQWNFYISKQLSEGLNLRLGLVNAFDSQRELSLNYPEPGRRYWLQIHYRFNRQHLF